MWSEWSEFLGSLYRVWLAFLALKLPVWFLLAWSFLSSVLLRRLDASSEPPP